jgi:hypothetical protein
MSDPLLDRIKAHRSAPDVYDPPTFDQMADRIRHLEDALKEIRDIAQVSEGAEFYSMVADKALKGAK